MEQKSADKAPADKPRMNANLRPEDEKGRVCALPELYSSNVESNPCAICLVHLASGCSGLVPKFASIRGQLAPIRVHSRLSVPKLSFIRG
jgi:hypothetical protein